VIDGAQRRPDWGISKEFIRNMGHNVPKAVPLFRADRGVTLLGGGPLAGADLADALALAPHLVAADGGANAALAAGQMPAAVYGDMDSLAPEIRARIPPERIHSLAEQDSTDFDKALRHIQAPFVVAAGFTGARVDHELAVYHGLASRPDQRCVVLGAQDVILHAPPQLILDLPADTRLSLFPLADVTGRSDGLVWPIDGLGFHPSRRIGTSNRARGGQVALRFDAPGMLLIVPRALLPVVVSALAQASVWPRAPGLASL
jgi:thiamine pyrophosphokinase